MLMLNHQVPWSNSFELMQLNAEARQILVDSYVALRKGDTAPGNEVFF